MSPGAKRILLREKRVDGIRAATHYCRMENTARHAQIFKNVQLRDHLGRPVDNPKHGAVLSAKQMRTYYIQGMARVGKFDDRGQSGDPIRESLVRAQVPYIVTLLVYHSKFQIEPTHREYFIYAPMEVQKAAELALRLWQRWERPPRPEFMFEDLREVYPKVDDGVVAEPISDSTFDAHWRDVSKRKNKCAGDPEYPFAFTCLDQDVMLQKVTDFQAGLNVKIR